MADILAGGTDASTTFGAGGSALLSRHASLKAAESLSPPDTLWAHSAATGTLSMAPTSPLQQQLQQQQSRSFSTPMAAVSVGSISLVAPQGLHSQALGAAPEAHHAELPGLRSASDVVPAVEPIAIVQATAAAGHSAVAAEVMPSSNGELSSHSAQALLSSAQGLTASSPRSQARAYLASSPSRPGTNGGIPNANAGGASELGAEDDDGIISIGDRIEGIRACLEARLGTQRFQKLYKSLSSDDDGLAAAVALAGGMSPPGAQPDGLEKPGVLSEELDEVFADAGDCSSDVGSLAPLVAKLVACEHSYFS